MSWKCFYSLTLHRSCCGLFLDHVDLFCVGPFISLFTYTLVYFHVSWIRFWLQSWIFLVCLIHTSSFSTDADALRGGINRKMIVCTVYYTKGHSCWWPSDSTIHKDRVWAVIWRRRDILQTLCGSEFRSWGLPPMKQSLNLRNTSELHLNDLTLDRGIWEKAFT